MPRTKTGRGRSGDGKALHAAVLGGHEEIVNDLLERGASVAAKDTDDRTPLHVAAQGGKPTMVQLLMLRGADKDALDRTECTPLYLALCNGHVATALALLAGDADASLPCSPFRDSVVHVAARLGHVEILRAVIAHGADVEATDFPARRTALHCAAMNNTAEAIDLLVGAGASIAARDQIGRTPLHFAATTASLEVLLALLKHGADVNAQDSDRETPLHCASRETGTQGAAEVVDCLLRWGADETVVNADGNAAADVIGINVGEDDSSDEGLEVAEDVERMRELLTNAPADRAWRRRGYMVLCRAHPDRIQPIRESSSATAGVAGSTRSGTTCKLARTEASGFAGTAGGSTASERTSGDWAGLVAMALGLREEGVFRAIVGYL